MKKVLIATAHVREQKILEEALEEKVDVLLFADRKESVLKLVKEQKPQLIFMDPVLMGTDKGVTFEEGITVVLIIDRGEQPEKEGPFLERPLHKRKVVATAEAFLGPLAPSSPPLPM